MHEIILGGEPLAEAEDELTRNLEPVEKYEVTEEEIEEEEDDSMFNEVCMILAQQLHLDAADISPDSRIKDDLGADSLDILQLLMTIEEEKGIVIPDEALAAFSTVGDVVGFLEQQDANQPDPFE